MTGVAGPSTGLGAESFAVPPGTGHQGMPVPMTTSTRELLESTDWSATALGPREAWPPTMHAVVDALLGSGFPVCTAWGPSLVQIYNDGYIPIVGAKHPQAFGATVAWARSTRTSRRRSPWSWLNAGSYGHSRSAANETAMATASKASSHNGSP